MAIVIDVLRHGRAHAGHLDGDAGRTLTDEGAAAVRHLARRLAGEGWRPDRVWCSPLVRAVETARLVTEPLRAPPAIERLEALAPTWETDDCLDELASRVSQGVGHALVVGHQPLLGSLVERLTGSEPRLTPGTLVRVQCPDGLRPGTGRVVLAIEPGAG